MINMYLKHKKVLFHYIKNRYYDETYSDKFKKKIEAKQNHIN